MTDSLPIPADEMSKGERTRMQIMEAALNLFTQQGYHGTSMRQIAESAGIALGGIYNHFDGKEEIFVEVAKAFHPINQILPALDQAQGDTVDDMVHQSAQQMFDTLSEREDFVNLMFIEIVEFKGKHLPSIFNMMFPRALKFGEKLKKKEGNLRQDLPFQVIIVTFIGLMFMYFLFRQIFGSLVNMGTPKKVLHQIVDIYLYGIVERDSAS